MRLQAFRLAALGVVASFVGIAPAESVTDSNFAETAALLHDGRFDAAERRTRPRAASSDLPAVFQDAFVYYWRLLYDEKDAKLARFGVFGTTLVAFFLAEMGDKTQIATVALAAQYQAGLVAVVAGTTLGMMIANVPAVLLGDRIAGRMPVRLVHGIAAAIFAALGVATLLGVGEGLGF